VFEPLECCLLWVQPCTIPPAKLAPDCGNLGRLWSGNDPLRHGWGWHYIQIASHIHIRHTHSAWEHWYAVHRHMVAALHTIILANSWLRFDHTGSLGEPKWCQYFMIEADIHLRLLHTFILDTHKVVESLECCHEGIWVHPHTIPPAKMAPDWGILGRLWRNDAITSWLRLSTNSNCFPHQY
jgi:hypothetical protein